MVGRVGGQHLDAGEDEEDEGDHEERAPHANIVRLEAEVWAKLQGVVEHVELLDGTEALEDREAYDAQKIDK